MYHSALATMAKMFLLQIFNATCLNVLQCSGNNIRLQNEKKADKALHLFSITTYKYCMYSVKMVFFLFICLIIVLPKVTIFFLLNNADEYL